MSQDKLGPLQSIQKALDLQNAWANAQAKMQQHAQNYGMSIGVIHQAIGTTGEAPTPPVEPSAAQFLVLAVKERVWIQENYAERVPTSAQEPLLFANAETMQHAVASLKKDPLVKEIYIFKMMYGCKSKREWENTNVDV